MENEKTKGQSPIEGKHRRYCFTWNNYTEEEVENLKNLDNKKCDYLIFGFEKGEETGTPHLQGYVEFSSPLAMTTAKSRLDPIKKKKSGVSLSVPKKVRQAQINYCKKEETTDEEAKTKYGGGSKFIEISHKEKRQGERTDWIEKYEFLEENPSFIEFAKQYPEDAVKYHGGIDRVIHAIKEKQQKEAFEQRYENALLQPWQENLVRELQRPANDRKIIWIWDTIGKKGKTWVSNYLVAKHGGVRFCNASCKDIAHAYNGESIVSFDFTRTTVERINYQVIEELKGGSIFSPKYNSSFKYFAVPHIICFANSEPNRNAVSADRWDIRCLDETHIALPVQDKATQADLEDQPALGAYEAPKAQIEPKGRLEANESKETQPRNTIKEEAELEDNITNIEDIDIMGMLIKNEPKIDENDISPIGKVLGLKICHHGKRTKLW